MPNSFRIKANMVIIVEARGGCDKYFTIFCVYFTNNILYNN